MGEAQHSPRKRKWGDRVLPCPAQPCVMPPAEFPCDQALGPLSSCLGWYWGSITASEARQHLQKMPEGTFLVRDSTHPSYLFTLSVKTTRGPTNVRIEYADSSFRLDSNCLSRPRILAFPDVVSLVQHYVASCAADTRSDSPDPAPTPALPTPKEDVPGDPALPAPAVTAVHLKLVQPFVRRSSARSLQHLCRLVINRLVADVDCLPLPRRMADYLRQYPFQL